MRLSTSTCIHEKVLRGKTLFYSCEESIAACVQAGYQVLDMNFSSYSQNDLPMTQPDWEDWVKRLKEFSDSLGVEWGQAHAHFYDWETTPPVERAWNEELIRRSLIGAGILGIKWLVIHPGSVNDQVWYSWESSLKSNVEACQRYGDLASKYNVGIAIENMMEKRVGRHFASSTEELMELHERLDDPMFGICWDTGHAHMAGIDQVAALKRIGKRLTATHIADNHGITDDHVAPYFGTIHWEPVMKTLREIRYEGDFSFEIHNFTNGLPHGLQEKALRFTYELGTFMLENSLS